MNVNKNKKYIIISFIFLSIIISGIVLLKSSNANVILDEVKLKGSVKPDSGMFAILVKGANGYESSDTIPSNMILNLEKSNCIDNNGQIVEDVLSFEIGIVNVSAGETVFCYLYFDKMPPDISLVVSTDGINDTIPTTGIYNVNSSCSNGNVMYNNYYQRLEIGSFRNGTNCSLNYVKDETEHTLLSSVVQNANSTSYNGYRYSGTNPNNYIWFNNELWRIIGLIPVCTAASDGTCSDRTTSLVKIIRHNSIGSIAYDAKASGNTGVWGSNTLYTLLNEYYYGKKYATDSGYCYGYTPSSAEKWALAKCDYREIGISDESNDYYGQMIESVYWNTGGTSYNYTPKQSYTYEIRKVTSEVSKIGIMSASDYGYAVTSSLTSNYSSNFIQYSSADISLNNWFYGQGPLWTNNQYASDASYACQILGEGTLQYFFYGPAAGLVIKPVVYLKANVYKISGTGSETDPYIIGM